MKRTTHRGMTSVLAMLYMVLFSALAVGFYAATTMQVQVAGNDGRAALAYSAAESGMDYMRYELSLVSIPASTTPSQVISVLATQLKSQIENTRNFGSNTLSLNGNTIEIPDNLNSYIPLDSARHISFRATITDWAGQIAVKVMGRDDPSGVTRTITMDYTRQAHTTTLFDGAVVSRGKIQISKGTITGLTDPTIASVMSALNTYPSIAMTGGTVGGDLFTVGDNLAQVTGGSVGGASNVSVIYNNHVHTASAPDFPVIDTSVYKQYATNSAVDKNGAMTNMIIKKGTNPKFTGNSTIQGILYVESPNALDFKGTVDLYGFIVFENSNGPDTNTISFGGNVAMHPLPASSDFDTLRATTGVAILAPSTAISLTGASGKGSTLTGNVIASTINFSGASSMQIDRGSMVTYASDRVATSVSTSKSITFTATGKNNQPNLGLSYSSYFVPVAGSFQEVSQ